LKHFSHLNTAVLLIAQYRGEMPFSIFLKSFFAQHKKYGSNDRKSIGQLCYSYFRVGKAMPNASIEEKILAAPETIPVTDIFPWKDELSEGIDHEAFCRSFLIQPDLFIRLRPGHEASVKRKLEAASISFKEVTPTCLALPNSSKINNIIDIDREAVIQDLNSQQTGRFFQPNFPISQSKISKSVWDCCAASGGKSILAYDNIPNIQLTVSDVRESIIANLKKRFAVAGIRNYKSFVADLSLSNPTLNLKPQTLNLIILDAPCSGSGTWSRTPEQLAFFNTESIDKYASLQKKIASNAVTYLSKGGRLVYITCSVFKKENEEAVDFITQKLNLQLEHMETLTGYSQKADTLFVASFNKTAQG